MEIVDSMQFVFFSDRRNAPVAEAGDGEHLLEPPREATLQQTVLTVEGSAPGPVDS